MSHTDTQAKASRAAEILAAEARDRWMESAASRLREIGGASSAEFVSTIRKRLSFADANHIQSYVNFLRGMESGWRESDAEYAKAIAEDLAGRAARLEEARNVILALVGIAWQLGT